MEIQSDSFTYHEIMSQAVVWKETLENIQADQESILTWLKNPREQVIFTGCGSTYYLSLHAAAVWQYLTREYARGIPASDLWLFPEMYLTNPSTFLVAISRSAITSETINALKVFQERVGGNSVAITCYPERELSKAAKHVLAAGSAAEQSVVQTRSFTSMVLSVDYLAGLAANRVDFIDEIISLPKIAKRLINSYEQDFARLGRNLDIDRFVFLGSGAAYSLACEAMLKVKEMTLSNSEAYHFLEFRHGPKSIVDAHTAVIGLLSDSARKEEAAVLADMRELGAYVVAIDETGDNLPADEIYSLGSGVGELLRGVLALPLMQLLAYYRACEKQLDPDRPLNLTSVVHLG